MNAWPTVDRANASAEVVRGLVSGFVRGFAFGKSLKHVRMLEVLAMLVAFGKDIHVRAHMHARAHTPARVSFFYNPLTSLTPLTSLYKTRVCGVRGLLKATHRATHRMPAVVHTCACMIQLADKEDRSTPRVGRGQPRCKNSRVLPGLFPLRIVRARKNASPSSVAGGQR